MKLTRSVTTVGELRELVALLDREHVPDTAVLRARVGLGVGLDGGPLKDVTVRTEDGGR